VSNSGILLERKDISCNCESTRVSCAQRLCYSFNVASVLFESIQHFVISQLANSSENLKNRICRNKLTSI